MGKLLHKLAHGIMSSWIFTGFWPNVSSKNLLRFRHRRRISTTSSAPTSPAPLDADLVYLLMDMDQSTYYYSQSEGEQEQPITGNSNHIPSPSIQSKSHNDDDDHHHHHHHLHVSHNPRMGICAIAATSIIKGRWHDDKHQPPFANKGIKYPTSPASINLQSQHDNDDHRHFHRQEGHPYPIEDQTTKLTRSSRETGVIKGGCHDNGRCGHGCHHQHQHQRQPDENHQQHHVADVNQSLQHHGPRTNQHPQHHAGDGSLYKHDDDVYRHAHHNQTYSSTQPSMESHRNLIYSNTQPSMENHPISSLAMGTEHNYDHHYHCHHEHRNQCQINHQYYQHNASNSKYYHQPYLREFKRKSICLDENEGKEDGNDENNYHYSMRAWPCLKRQKTQEEVNMAYKLPECIRDVVGNVSAVVQYSYENAQFSFWESMVEMIVGNELWGVAELEFLLHCYLALNEPHLHHIICTSFLQVLKDLQQILALQRCTSLAQEHKENTI